MLSIGSEGLAVTRLQQALSAAGHPCQVTGLFDIRTRRVLMAFQQTHSIKQSGVVDPETELVLNRPRTVLTVKKTIVVILTQSSSQDEIDLTTRSLSWSFDFGTYDVIVTPMGDDFLESTKVAISRFQDHDIVFPIKAGVEAGPGLKSLILAVRAEKLSAAYGSSNIDGVWSPAEPGWVLMEKLQLGMVVFSRSSIPAKLPTRGSCAFEFMLTAMVFSGVKVSGIPTGSHCSSVVSRVTDGTADEAEWRRRAYAAHNHGPKVSALMVTGKCPERIPLAKVAIECWRRQSWQNKELVIVNHGDQALLDKPEAGVIEVRTTKGPGVSLGDLRNMSIEAATGDWCIQWDDDDWHAPDRIKVQMAHAKPGHLVTMTWQIRCDLLNRSAFYDWMCEGQHMVVLFERSTQARYVKLERREDTNFFKQFEHRRIVIENGPERSDVSPFLYVRTYHGMNIWNREHIMAGSKADLDVNATGMRLSPYHRGLMEAVLDEYHGFKS